MELSKELKTAIGIELKLDTTLTAVQPKKIGNIIIKEDDKIGGSIYSALQGFKKAREEMQSVGEGLDQSILEGLQNIYSTGETKLEEIHQKMIESRKKFDESKKEGL